MRRMHGVGRHPWRALLVAPLAFPFAFAAALELSSPGRHPLAGFLTVFAIGCVLSYAATVFLLLPCLMMVARGRALTPSIAACIGAVLGAIAQVPLLWMSWRASGPDSGPPLESFPEYALASGVEMLFMPVAGLLTAMLFRAIARPVQ
jgi:hypothetical protein